MTRRPESQSFGFEADSSYSGSEFTIKRSNRIEQKQFSLEISRDDTQVQSVFGLDSGMAAIGGYVFTPYRVQVDIQITAAGDSEHRSIEMEPGRWNGIGCHLKSPIGNHSIAGEITFQLSEDPDAWVDFFGVDIAPLDYWIYTENLEYSDGKTARNRFFEDEHQYVPAKYYINTDSPLPEAQIKSDMSEIKDGRLVVLKSCNRAPDHFHPIGVGRRNEEACRTFANHIRNKRLKIVLSESTADPYKIVDEGIGERIIRPRNFNTSEQYTGFIHNSTIYSGEFDLEGLQLDEGYQYECNACKKFEVNNEGNWLRSPEQRFEDSQRRRSIQQLIVHNRILDIDRGNNFKRETITEFGGCFLCDKEDSDNLEIDHLMPLSYMWPLKGNAVPLCESCHKYKGTTFPKHFYDIEQRKELLKSDRITIGGDIHKKKINEKALHALLDNIGWFFDSFLQNDVENGGTDVDVPEKIVSSLHRKFRDVDLDVNLIQEYENQRGKSPETVNTDLIED